MGQRKSMAPDQVEIGSVEIEKTACWCGSGCWHGRWYDFRSGAIALDTIVINGWETNFQSQPKIKYIKRKLKSKKCKKICERK